MASLPDGPRTHRGVQADPTCAVDPALGFWTEAGVAWAGRAGQQVEDVGGRWAPRPGWREGPVPGRISARLGFQPPRAASQTLSPGGFVWLVSFSPPLSPCSIPSPPAPLAGLERELAPPLCPPPPPPPPLMSISALLSMGRCCCRCCCPRGLWMLSAPCCDDRRMCVCPGPRRIGRYSLNYLRWVPRKDGD